MRCSPQHHTHIFRLRCSGGCRLHVKYTAHVLLVFGGFGVPVGQREWRPGWHGSENQAKADLLYDAIDSSNFYSAPVARADRSIMNVPFTLADDALDGEFLAQAEARGLFNLKGHRSVGGMRASIYNAVPLESVQALVTFMGEFENERG